jgi:hypothetical protein
MESYRSDFETNMTTMTGNLIGAFGKWRQNVGETFKLVGQDFDDFAKPEGPLDQKTQ